MIFCNKCPLSILTQVFVSYFCFVTSQSCTISCRQTNHKYSIILDIKRKHNFKHFLLYTYCRNTNPKGRALKSWRCTELSLKQKERILFTFRMLFSCKQHNSNFEDFFLVFRLLSFLRGHSVFSSPPQWPMTSNFEGFLYQILSITLFSYLNSSERASNSLFNVEC